MNENYHLTRFANAKIRNIRSFQWYASEMQRDYRNKQRKLHGVSSPAIWRRSPVLNPNHSNDREF
jgi:hypothetical protein